MEGLIIILTVALALSGAGCVRAGKQLSELQAQLRECHRLLRNAEAALEQRDAQARTLRRRLRAWEEGEGWRYGR